MLNIALFGPPGAGKGTQSEYLIKRYNLFYISTGDLLRKEMSEKTKLGLEAQSVIAQGGLVSDEIIVQIIEKTITENTSSDGFLFDGFPRTYVQAYILEGLMLKLNTSLHRLISLTLPEELAVQRLVSRGRTSGRSDDNEQVIRNRLREYNQKTRPVLNFYRAKGMVSEVDGSEGVDDVREQITQIIGAELSRRLFNVVLFGPPGSGRGSQGKAIASKFGLQYLGCGAMLEDEIQRGTELGKKMLPFFQSGQLVPDEIVVPLIERKLEQTRGVKGFVFKGFPRTLVQSYILDGLLKKHGASINKIIELQLPTLELVRRLDERSKRKAKPFDASTTMIVNRLTEHELKTMPVIEKYAQRHGVTKIDGTGTFDQVFDRVAVAIEEGLRSMR
ncbi:MAG: adenylate kinase [Anaeromyxobacter sp.]